MADKKPNTTVRTPKARLSFPNLFKAVAPSGDPDGTKKFGCTLLFDKAAQATKEYKALEKEVERVIKEKWGDERPRKLKLPFLTIDDLDKVPDGYTDEHTFIRIASTSKPSVVDQNVQPVMEADEVYAGCYVRASVRAYAWEHKTGGKGVSFGLNNVQKMGDGEPFSSKSKAEDDFDEVENDDDLLD